MPKIGQPGGTLGRRLGPLLKAGWHLIGNLLKRLAKSFLIPLGLTKRHKQQMRLFIRKCWDMARRYE